MNSSAVQARTMLATLKRISVRLIPYVPDRVLTRLIGAGIANPAWAAGEEDFDRLVIAALESAVRA